ncbi:hypothetical protein [Terribacillus sp. DMT04]|uniref:hypothetical protein n=1 Tax=Terribacillus sp. DMT04 TaxID=2850441 RepID=UPI001C2C5F47|nr:hypothetical protein [Terribacillus sp. DMT04]QXE01912.1 hypothetical protein KS242_01225 [Terribacillus sp. DMT04]
MTINRSLNDLKELEVHLKNIEGYIYSHLGLLDDRTLSNKENETHKKCKIEFELLNARLTDIRIDLIQRKERSK